MEKFPGAQYKAFTTREEAEQAFQQGNTVVMLTETLTKEKDYIEDSISVDAACSGNPGRMEYRGVYTKNGKEIFHFGPVEHGTNNIGEFLAIVHALALLQQKNSNIPIYSDSQTAISWVKNKRVKTSLPRNEATEKLWQLIDRAITWLENNEYQNPLIKWETERWGEIKADFGRK